MTGRGGREVNGWREIGNSSGKAKLFPWSGESLDCMSSGNKSPVELSLTSPSPGTLVYVFWVRGKYRGKGHTSFILKSEKELKINYQTGATRFFLGTRPWEENGKERPCLEPNS